MVSLCLSRCVDTIRPHCPIFHALTIPIQLIYAIALKIIGSLASLLGCKKWGDVLYLKGGKIDSRCGSIIDGFTAYGRRYLTVSENYLGHCRGSCYWLIHRHFQEPQTSLVQLATSFEDGPPLEAAEMHEKEQIPSELKEEKLWSENGFPVLTNLEAGVYTFLVGFSEMENHPKNAHRVALFKGDETFLFDPNTGLSLWEDSDWPHLLDRIGSQIRTSSDQRSFFTVECYRYRFG